MHQGMAALSPGPHWGNPPASAMLAAEYLYLHVDHLNTPKVLTDENQQVVWKGDYEPFGEVTETVSTIDMPLRYPGQIADDETGLHYNYFRTYDPSIGRYTQSDPIGLSDGPNTFAYVEANPILYMDRAGLFCMPLWSKYSAWKNTGNLRNGGLTMALPQSFGGLGMCSWKRLWLQEQKRTITPRELCYDCEEKCEGEECSWKIKEGTPRVEIRDHERWESGGKTNQVITGGSGREQGCCQDPWTGEPSCGPIYPRN